MWGSLVGLLVGYSVWVVYSAVDDRKTPTVSITIEVRGRKGSHIMTDWTGERVGIGALLGEVVPSIGTHRAVH